MERRKLNIQNYGNSWLKPPGIPKTLYQQREERREMEEHQEALRREQLAQELAEAEAEQGMGDVLQGEGMDEEDGGERDLDDDVPEADNTILTAVSEDEDVENDRAGNAVAETPAPTRDQALPPVRAMITEMRARAVAAANAVTATRIPARVPDDVYREAVARGEAPEPSGFDDSASTVDEEHGGMLQEEDLVHDGENYDMDMDADLDAEIPEADEPSGYEHTDTEDELSSSDDESVDAGRLPRQSIGAATSMIRSDGTQTSMDLSSLISGSSQVGSSPQLHDVHNRRRHM
jgi:hypothetical protein